MRSTLIATATLVLGFSAASARDLSCRIVVLDGEAPEDLRLVDAGSGDSEQVEPGASLDAEPVEISVSGKLLVQSGRDRESIAEVEVAPEVKEAVIFLLPSAEAADEEDADESPASPWTGVVADLGAGALDKGGVAVVNAGTLPAKVTLGSLTEPVEPASSVYLGDPAEDKDDFNMVPLKVEVEFRGRWRPLKDGSSRFTGDEVYWMVCFDRTGGNRPDMRIFKTSVSR